MNKDNVLIVDHGKIFDTEVNWLTFHCPYCMGQITRYGSNEKCEHCNREIKWKNS